MFAVSHNRHVCCVTHQICLLCHTAYLKRDKCKHEPPLHAQCKYNTTTIEGNSRQAPKAGRPTRPNQKAIRRTTSSCGVSEKGEPLHLQMRKCYMYICTYGTQANTWSHWWVYGWLGNAGRRGEGRLTGGRASWLAGWLAGWPVSWLARWVDSFRMSG